jgi:multidrug efflux system membrane fusion protein
MKRILVALLLLVAAGCKKADTGQGGRGAGTAGGAGAARVVPVVETKVAKRDVPIYLDGLGSVAANKTVTVKPQVDGRLDSVLFREGQEVKKGSVLAQIDPRPFRIQLHQAEGALARDMAQLENARLNLKRYTDLRVKKMVAQQQVDDTAAQVGQLEGAVRMDRAAIETAKLNLDYSRISAPIDGVAGVRQIDQGNLVKQSDPNGIVLLTQLDPIAVLFTLPQDDLPRVSEQMQKEPLVVEAFSRDGQNKLGTGELQLIDNQINATTATMRLKSLFPNPQRVLWPNQFVKARLLLTTKRDALVIPAAAVQRGPDGTFVYAISDDNTATAKNVQVDSIQGDLAIIAKGLQPGERIVIEGQNQLRPGGKVNPRPLGPAGAPAAPAREAAAPQPQPQQQQPAQHQPQQQPSQRQPPAQGRQPPPERAR